MRTGRGRSIDCRGAATRPTAATIPWRRRTSPASTAGRSSAARAAAFRHSFRYALLVGIAGITIAIVTLSGANTEGADADPVVTKAIATATVGPFLIAPMGFAALLAAGGLVTLRSGVFARWTGIVALIGALSFLITFLTTIDGTADGSVFGYGYFPGVLALVTWSIATSIARYRAVGPSAAPAVVRVAGGSCGGNNADIGPVRHTHASRAARLRDLRRGRLCSGDG